MHHLVSYVNWNVFISSVELRGTFVPAANKQVPFLEGIQAEVELLLYLGILARQALCVNDSLSLQHVF